MIPPYDEQAGTHIQYYTPCNDSAAVNALTWHVQMSCSQVWGERHFVGLGVG